MRVFMSFLIGIFLASSALGYDPATEIATKARNANIGAPAADTPTPIPTPVPPVVNRFRPQGWFQHFEGGWVYWSPSFGAQVVKGTIFGKWGETGWEQGALGFPVTDELPVPAPYEQDRYSIFEGGAIYWHAPTNTAVVTIKARLGLLLKGLPAVRITKMTSVCVASDSTNQPE